MNCYSNQNGIPGIQNYIDSYAYVLYNSYKGDYTIYPCHVIIAIADNAAVNRIEYQRYKHPPMLAGLYLNGDEIYGNARRKREKRLGAPAQSYHAHGFL